MVSIIAQFPSNFVFSPIALIAIHPFFITPTFFIFWVINFITPTQKAHFCGEFLIRLVLEKTKSISLKNQQFFYIETTLPEACKKLSALKIVA